MNFMNNPKVLKAVSVLAFIVSGIFTIQLMTSGTVGLFPFILTSMMAILLEITKCGFFYAALTNKNLNFVIRSTMATISVLLVMCSIFASAGYVTNQANKSKNNQIKTSTQFKQLQEARKLNQDLFEQKKAELAQLQGDKSKTISDMERIRDSYPRDYITVKENLTNKINQKAAELQKNIEAKSAELSQLSSTLSTPIDTTKLNVLDTKGYTSMFKVLAEQLNKSEEYQENPWTAQELEMWFFISLGIIFEIVAILTAYLAQLEACSGATSNKVQSPSNNKVVGFNKNIVTASNGNNEEYNIIEASTPLPRKIGFVPNLDNIEKNNTSNNCVVSMNTTYSCIIPGIENEDVKRYIEYMYENEKDNVSPGYIKISKDTNLELEKCRKIRAHLEHLNVLKSFERKTIILKPKESVNIF